MRRCSTSLAVCLIFAIAGCSKPETVQAPASPPLANTPGESQGSTKVIDPCSLLTSKEIEAIQGAPFKETKPSSNSQRGFTITQCYFLLPTAAESIVVSVTQRANGADARDPKHWWEETFHRDNDKANASREEEGEAASPEKIENVGDEAFWTPQRFGGALYVLKGNTYIRISVGGPDDRAAKLQKSKSLAEKVLKRL